MQLPVKAHYATLAMLALAQKYESRELLPSRIIAREHKIPNQFLGQILQQLRSAGLIHSTRGSNGGFQLERSPAQISVAEIVDAVCSGSAVSPLSEDASPLCEVVSEVWSQLHTAQREILEGITLGELLQKSTDADAMFYI